MEKEVNAKQQLQQFWKFLHKDTWSSLIVTLILAYIIIKFILFPTLSFISASSHPLLIVESCSMNHPGVWNLDLYWDQFGEWYENREITKQQFSTFPFKHGFVMGDIIFVSGKGEIEIGDIIIFNANARNPIIHRVVSIENEIYQTKGDFNTNQLTPNNHQGNINETHITKDQIIGKAIFRIPKIGWIKLGIVKIIEITRGISQQKWC